MGRLDKSMSTLSILRKKFDLRSGLLQSGES